MAKQPHKFFIKIMMKKILIFFICTLLFIGLISCRKSQKTPTDKSQTSVTSDHADVSTVNTVGGDITNYNSGEVYTGANKSEIRDILIPDDGQKIVYEPAFELFNDPEKGYSLVVNSAERSGDQIIFYTSETRYYFGLLSATILTPADELFIGLNGKKQDDGTFMYVTEKYPYTSKRPNDTTLDLIDKIKYDLGEQYDSSKSYYYTMFYFVTDVSQTVAE